MDDENLKTIECIRFYTFKEKLKITKQYERLAKMQIIDNKYIYLEWRR